MASLNYVAGELCTNGKALRAVQLERRMAKRREQENPTIGTTKQLTDAIPGASHSKESYWIDIETQQRSSDELYDFLRQLRLPPFFVSILSEPATWTSEVIALKQVSLAIFQILPTDPSSIEVAHVALLSMPRLLVTFSTYPQQSNEESDGIYQMVTQYLKQRERVPEPTSSGVLLAWLTFHVRRTARAVRTLRLAVSVRFLGLAYSFTRTEYSRELPRNHRPWRWTRRWIQTLQRLSSNIWSRRKIAYCVFYKWRKSRTT